MWRVKSKFGLQSNKIKMINDIDKKDYLKEQLLFINKYPLEVGSKIYEFEQDFLKYFGVKYASACTNWSAWLILSLKSLWIWDWDEVMLNCNYFVSNPNSIVMVWAKPIFIDLWKTINSLSLEDIKLKITDKTKALIIIHLYWYPIENTLEIVELCKEKGIKVIEDCCQSIWAKIWNKYIWTFWEFWIFSFDSNKFVKSWEWWMIISNDFEMIEKTKYFKNNCKIDSEFIELWYNFRFNDFSAIYAKYSLKNLENIINKRLTEKNAIENIYDWWENISPNYYNFIVKKQKPNNKLNKDFYNLNIDNYKNYKNHLENFEII